MEKIINLLKSFHSFYYSFDGFVFYLFAALALICLYCIIDGTTEYYLKVSHVMGLLILIVIFMTIAIFALFVGF